MMTDRPIPEFSDPDFRTVDIRDCGEPVLLLRPCSRIHIYPAYHARGLTTADPSIRLRTGVIEALRGASMTLPNGMNIVVYDGLRSLQTQKEIADRFAAMLADVPMPEEERAATISRFVAPLPVTQEDYQAAPPAHSTGAAVDVGLAGDDGGFVDLGADFDQFDETAGTTYYENLCRSAICSAEDLARRNRRRILYWAMIDAGFAPYPAEYWHFELGTRRAAAFQGDTSAKYGAIAPWPKKRAAAA
jgi:D-alanyl-D-alanine dipeptidase